MSMADAAAVGCGGGDCPDDDAPGVGSGEPGRLAFAGGARSGDVSSFFVRRLFVEVPCVLALFCATAVSMAVAAGDGTCADDGAGVGAVGAGVGTMGGNHVMACIGAVGGAVANGSGILTFI